MDVEKIEVLSSLLGENAAILRNIRIKLHGEVVKTTLSCETSLKSKTDDVKTKLWC